MSVFVVVSGHWEENTWGATTSFSEAMEIGERVEREEIANFVRIQKWDGAKFEESIVIPESEKDDE